MTDPTRHTSLVWRAAAIFAAITSVSLWHQVSHLSTLTAAHNDSLFGIWRIPWVAHQIRTDRRHLFDPNIFFPNRSTFAYSDPALAQAFTDRLSFGSA